MNRILIALVLGVLATSFNSFAGSVGPSFYECFDATQTTGVGQTFSGTCTAESPFAQILRDGNFSYFEFEDWEDVALNTVIDPIPTNTTGVAITGSGLAITGVQVLGSTDQDDGVIDNSQSTDGQRYGAFGQVDISFDAGALGQLPTHVGFVATGAGNFDSNIRVEFFGPGDELLGTFNNTVCPTGLPGNANCNVVSEDDLFYGFTNAGGIASVLITDPVNFRNIINFDHLQYGAVIPVPPAALLFGSGLALLGWIRRKAVNM
jgi:hypothetical protein